MVLRLVFNRKSLKWVGLLNLVDRAGLEPKDLRVLTNSHKKIDKSPQFLVIYNS